MELASHVGIKAGAERSGLHPSRYRARRQRQKLNRHIRGHCARHRSGLVSGHEQISPSLCSCRGMQKVNTQPVVFAYKHEHCDVDNPAVCLWVHWCSQEYAWWCCKRALPVWRSRTVHRFARNKFLGICSRDVVGIGAADGARREKQSLNGEGHC